MTNIRASGKPDLDEANYPESLKAALVLDAGWIFQLLFNVVKTWIPSKTLSKVQVLDHHTDRDQLIQTVVSLDQLKTMAVKREKPESQDNNGKPKTKGKSRVSTKEQSASGSNALVSNIFSSLPGTEPNLCKQTIRPKCYLTLKFSVTEPNMDLVWAIRLHRKGQVMFAAYRRPIIHQTIAKDRVSEFKVPLTPTHNGDKSEFQFPNVPKLCGQQQQQGDEDEAIKTAPEQGQDQDQAAKEEEASEQDDVVAIFEEVDEETGASEDQDSDLEVVEKPRKISDAKDFYRGRVECEEGYMYSIVLENKSMFFTSRTVEYNIKLVPRSLGSADEATTMDPEDVRKAKMDDLLHFVNEITNADLVTKPNPS